ncbi:ABC transporter G family member 38 [Phytophthora rubi]|uniref:ABC transporter G family member 38 n=1 Tax=Phytophthora rubi TaxID=129364 RepID=A0A6A3MHM7_9STRA|nr:ABC transporter G family member 38 [Phytophthora rubi]
MLDVDESPPRPADLSSGKAMMANGPHALHSYVADTFEAAIGRKMPQMEVRYQNLSVTANVAVTGEITAKSELPTVFNTIKRSLAKFAWNKRVVQKEIIKNVSGVLKPGTITLLLGQPGSGKTSLMRVLAGQFPKSGNVKIEGDVTYNGVPREEIIRVLPQFSAYVTQFDKHFPTLTVRETLEFAYAVCGGGMSKHKEEMLSHGAPEQNAKALEAARQYFEHFPDLVIEQLGLHICQDTIIGSGMLRGVSGGERKRVTTGETEFGMKYMTLMDEISTGLDSAATFDIITTQRSIAKCLHKTIVIALLQPAPEVFNLFDDVMVLNDGEIIYHGPREQAVPYFETLGFKCPPGRDAADFLLDLGTNMQKKYEAELPLGMIRHPRVASEFSEHWRESPLYGDLIGAVNAPHDPERVRDVEEHMKLMPEFRQSFWENTKTVTARQWRLTKRNTSFIYVRALMTVVMGLIYGSSFYQVDPTNAQMTIGVLFQATIFMSLGQTAQVPTFYEAREVFYKHRSANFYRSSSFAIANSLALIPQAIGESLVFGSLVYWMSGLVPDAGHFVIFLVIMVLVNLSYAAWFFCLTAICPSFNIAKPMSTFTIVIFNLFGGFVMAKNVMPDWLIWVYYLVPDSWSLRALCVNQYRAARFDVCVYDGVDYCSEYGMTMGEYFLKQFAVPSNRDWVWTGIIYMIGLYVFLMALGALVLEYKRYDGPVNTFLKPKDESNDDSKKDTSDYVLATTPKHSGTSAGSGSATHDVAVDVPVREKMFVPVTIAFQDLWYSVPKPGSPKESLELLKGISGFAEPGTLTALMGSSGAGKTTLMDVIAGRKTGGKITGRILLNGYEANDLAIRRATGYCEQMDVHSDASTIRESLTFSAFLRQDSSIPDSKKYDTVNECLDLLDMHEIADKIVRGCSQEQMKRLTIGVELAAQPSILFLDEPTSGLDAHSAKLIMDGVRKVADSGRTIVCTIHQPSSDVFFLFDHLLLLKRGGESVFVGELGEKCHKLVDYLEAIPGTPPCPKDQNPASWMLEVIGAGVSSTSSNTTDFVQCFHDSEEKRILDAQLDRPGVTQPSPDLPEILFEKKRAASSYTQMRFLIKRFNDRYWRTPTYNITRFAIALGLGILFAIVFANKSYETYQEINAGIAMVFMTSMFNGVISFTGTLPISFAERAPYYRERASQTYNCLWYFVGSTVAEIPYVFFSTALFTIVFYSSVGFTNVASGFMFWVANSLFVLMQTYLGQLFIYAMPTVEVAAIVGVLYNSICLIFAGFNPPAANIPRGYHWLYLITPQKYSMGLLNSLVFTDCPELPTWNETTGEYEGGSGLLACHELTNAPSSLGHTTVKEYVESNFEYKHAEIWSNFGYILVFIVVYRVLALMALRFINHQKR